MRRRLHNAGPDNDDFHVSILGPRRRRRPSCARDERLVSRHVMSHAYHPRARARECQRSPRWRTRHHDRRCRITLGSSGSSKMTWIPPSWTRATTHEGRGRGCDIRVLLSPESREHACESCSRPAMETRILWCVRARDRAFPRNFPLGCPEWCRPGGSLACPVGAPSAANNPDKKVWAGTRGSARTSAARRSGCPSVRAEGVGAGEGGGSAAAGNGGGGRGWPGTTAPNLSPLARRARSNPSRGAMVAHPQ